MLYVFIAIVLWYAAPLFVAGHIRTKTDRKTWTMLTRIAAVSFVLLALGRFFAMAHRGIGDSCPDRLRGHDKTELI